MSDAVKQQIADLTARAARRSMTVRSTAEGWRLASPWRVVVLGDLDAIGAWLDAAESYDRRPRQLYPTGCKADS